MDAEKDLNLLKSQRKCIEFSWLFHRLSEYIFLIIKLGNWCLNSFYLLRQLIITHF